MAGSIWRHLANVLSSMPQRCCVKPRRQAPPERHRRLDMQVFSFTKSKDEIAMLGVSGREFIVGGASALSMTWWWGTGRSVEKQPRLLHVLIMEYTNSDFARRMKASNEHLFWSCLDIPCASGKVKVHPSESDRKVQHSYLRSVSMLNSSSFPPQITHGTTQVGPKSFMTIGARLL